MPLEELILVSYQEYKKLRQAAANGTPQSAQREINKLLEHQKNLVEQLTEAGVSSYCCLCGAKSVKKNSEKS